MLNDEHNVGNNRTKELQIVFYLLIVNLVVDALITSVNIFFTPDYFSQLLRFSLRNILVFVVVMILILILTIIPVIIGQRYKEWSEDKQTAIFFKTLTIISVSIIGLASFGIYFTIYADYPLLMNPLLMNDSNQIISLLSPFWWFFSYNLGLILIFLLYIYLES